MVDQSIFSSDLATTTAALSLYTHPHDFDRSFDTALALLWFMFSIMLVGSITFAALSWRVPAPKRVYHYIATTVTTISTLSYFSMATYVGAVMVHAAIHDPQGPRPEIYERILYQVYWARYVDWTLTLPLTLLIISMISGLDLASVFAVVVAAFIMVLSGFFSMASHNKGEKFGWFTFALLAYLLIAHQILGRGRSLARKRGQAITKFYTNIAVYLSVVWLGYIIFWILTGQNGVLSIDVQIGVYAVLDVLSKSVFGAWLLFTYAKVPDLGTGLGDYWLGGVADEGRIRVGEEEEG